MQQLLWIETLLKASGGLVLLLAPNLAIRVLGLPRSETAFWPRLLGALLLGLAVATFLEGYRGTAGSGLGTKGAAVINLIAIAAVASCVALDPGAEPAWRGRIVLMGLVALLLTLSLLELLVG